MMNTTDILLANLGIKELSDMQINAGEIIQDNSHVVLLAPTGTGKTLAFLLPLIKALEVENKNVQALILSPTRELAEQTFNVLSRMKSPLRVVCLHGGRPAMDEHRLLKASNPQVLVGTPGRVNDHMDKENFKADTITFLVIDEFDKMLELKFQDELERIISRLTGVNNCVLVSATNAKEIPDFVGFRHHSPIYLKYLGVKEVSVPTTIQHFVVHSSQKDKLDTLRRLLCKLEGEQAVVFVGFRESVERVGNFLKEQGFHCSLFHGGLEQEERERALYMFAAGTTNVLVSTDLSARGLDIPTLRNVIHYHLPIHCEDYLHRCGRTGRWERDGNSFILLGPEEEEPVIPNVIFVEYVLNPPFPPPAEPQWVTVYIGKGKKDKLSRGDVVGYLCKQGGAKPEDLGRIDVRDYYTYVAIRRVKYRQTLQRCVGEKIKKMSTRVELMKS